MRLLQRQSRLRHRRQLLKLSPLPPTASRLQRLLPHLRLQMQAPARKTPLRRKCITQSKLPFDCQFQS